MRNLMKPWRFRFTDDADVAKYGGDWHVYDEAVIVRLPARQQALLEAAMGLKLIPIMEGFREDTIMGRLGVTWLTLHLADPDKAGTFADFEPLVLLMDFEQVDEQEDVTAPLDPTPSADSPPSPSTE